MSNLAREVVEETERKGPVSDSLTAGGDVKMEKNKQNKKKNKHEPARHLSSSEGNTNLNDTEQ